MIERVTNDKYADLCDALLTKLILDEKSYDQTLNEKYVVKNYFKNVIKNKDNILLGKIMGELVIAYIYLKPIKIDSNDAYLIDGLFVEEEYRNRGIAKELIKKALDILKSKNIKLVDINTMYDNELAKNLYKSFGFKELKIQMRKEI